MEKQIEKELDDFESSINDELDQFESISPQEDTIEKKLGFDKAYDVFGAATKAIAPLSKIATVPIATTLETVAEGPKAGYNALYEELTNLQPTEKSSISYQLRKIPELSEPIMESPIKDISQGENIKAFLKAWSQKNFPKAYGVASQVSPADIIGMSADVGLGQAVAPFTSAPVARGLGRIGDVAIKKAINNTEKAIERMSSLSGENASEASNLLKTRKAAMTAMEYGLTKKLRDPNELQTALNGERDIVPDELTGKKSIKIKPGLIDNLTDVVNDIADDISDQGEPIRIKEIADDVYNKIAEKISDPDSGATWNQQVANSLKSRISNFFKTTDFGLEDIENAVKSGNIDQAIEMQNAYNQSNSRNFKSLIKLKRAAADKVYEINKNPEIYGVEGATDKAIFKEIWDQIDNKVNNMAKSGNEKVGDLIRYNSELSDMLHLKNMTQKARLEGMASLTLPEMAAGTAATTAAASAAGYPMMGLAYAPARAAMKMGETNIPAYLAPAQEAIGKIAYNGSIGQNSLSKAPALIAGFGMAAGGSSAEKFLNSKSGVNLFQIPRTSEGALQNIDLVKAKIEREFGPEVVAQMDSIKDSSSFTNFMADLANMNPMAFTPDPYNRFDGVIKHPVLKTKALEDIVKNGNMSVLDKANSAEELMINSKFHGSHQQ